MGPISKRFKTRRPKRSDKLIITRRKKEKITMTRSYGKAICSSKLLKKIDKLKDAPNKKPIKTWSRNLTIIPDFVGHSFMTLGTFHTDNYFWRNGWT